MSTTTPCGATPCPALRLIVTAYHESGHAVTAYASWPQDFVEFATIVPGDGYLGRVTHTGWSDDWRDDVEGERRAVTMLAEADTICYLAGAAAEARFRGDHAGLASGAGWTPDDLGAHDSASATWDGDIDEKHHVVAYVGPTYRLLEQPEVWLAIARRVAGALLRHLTLSGAEVEAIIKGAGIEPDRYREPLFCEDEVDDEAFSWSRW